MGHYTLWVRLNLISFCLHLGLMEPINRPQNLNCNFELIQLDDVFLSSIKS